MGGRDDARRRVWARAREQHGVITRQQMLRCGLTPRQVERLVARGEAVRRYEGVFVLGPVSSSAAAPMAAVLACGPQAWLSHRSGAVLLGVATARSGAPFDV